MRAVLSALLLRPRTAVQAPITYTNPWVVAAYNSNYSTALAAVSNGQNFGYVDDNGEVAHIYSKSGGNGTYLDTIPYRNGVQADQDFIENARVRGGVATGAKADIFTVDSYYHYLKIKNRTLSTPDLNALGSSRPAMFLAAGMLATSSVTSAASTAEDASQSAVRLVNASGSTHNATLTYRGLPGLWNYSFRAKTETGSSQTVGAGLGSSSTITVTTAWQDFSINAAHSTNTGTKTLFLAADVAGAAFDITVDQIRVTPGNVSGAASTEDHPFNKSTSATRTAGYVTNTDAVKTNPYIPLSIDNTTTRTAISVVMAVKKTGADHTIMPFAVEVETGSELNSAPNGGFLFEVLSTATWAGGSNSAVSRKMTHVTNGEGWMIVGMVSGPSGSKFYLDNLVLSIPVTAAWTGYTARMLELLTFRNGTGFQGQLASCVVYESELSDSAMQTQITLAKSRVALIGGTVQVIKNIFLTEGDSITAGSGASTGNGYVLLVGAHFSPYLQGYNQAVINATLSGNAGNSLLSRQAQFVAKIAEVVASGRRPIISVAIGTNDVNGDMLTSYTTYYNTLKTYWAALRTAGAYVVACTVLPQQSLAGASETARLNFNGLVRAGSSDWDGLADFANAAQFVGGWSGTYFADSAHPNDAGHAVMDAILTTAVTPLVLV